MQTDLRFLLSIAEDDGTVEVRTFTPFARDQWHKMRSNKKELVLLQNMFMDQCVLVRDTEPPTLGDTLNSKQKKVIQSAKSRIIESNAENTTVSFNLHSLLGLPGIEPVVVEIERLRTWLDTIASAYESIPNYLCSVLVCRTGPGKFEVTYGSARNLADKHEKVSPETDPKFKQFLEKVSNADTMIKDDPIISAWASTYLNTIITNRFPTWPIRDTYLYEINQSPQHQYLINKKLGERSLNI